MNVILEKNLCFDKSLEEALIQQIDEQCKKIRNDCLMRVNEKVQKKIKDLENEHLLTVSDEMTQKAEALSKRFKELEKHHVKAIDEQLVVENSSKSAKMRYDKLNVRLMNSGLRINQLKPKVEQMDPRNFIEKAVQGGINYAKATAEIQQLVQKLKSGEEKRDEYKTKLEFAKSDEIELNCSLNDAKLKLQRESENISRNSQNLNEISVEIENKIFELNEIKKENLQVEEENQKLEQEIQALQNEVTIN